VVGHRCGTAASQGLEGPVTDYRPAKATRTAQIHALVSRPSGATLAQITGAPGWQLHSVRGFMASAGMRSAKQRRGRVDAIRIDASLVDSVG
jgi:hypothetical protein